MVESHKSARSILSFTPTPPHWTQAYPCIHRVPTPNRSALFHPRPYEAHLDGSSFPDGATIPPSRPYETRSCARNRSAATHSILRAHQIHGPHTRAAKRLSLHTRIKWLGDADHLWNSRCKPQTVTRRIASITMALLIFDLPRTRSGNTIGTSTIVPPAAATRRVMSIWNT